MKLTNQQIDALSKHHSWTSRQLVFAHYANEHLTGKDALTFIEKVGAWTKGTTSIKQRIYDRPSLVAMCQVIEFAHDCYVPVNKDLLRACYGWRLKKRI